MNDACTRFSHTFAQANSRTDKLSKNMTTCILCRPLPSGNAPSITALLPNACAVLPTQESLHLHNLMATWATSAQHPSLPDSNP